MLESGVNEHHVVKIAGWRSEKMLARYGHARIEEQLAAVHTLLKKPVQKIPELTLAVSNFRRYGGPRG